MGKNVMKRILIIDETVFSQICSAILELEGYKIETYKTAGEKLRKNNTGKFGLIITSYPFCKPVLKEIEESNIPKIILSDNLNKEMINLLKSLTKSFCMIKPIDYDEFRSLVKTIITDNRVSLLNSFQIL
jgi:DNA-binding NtrC family response regulator